MARSRKNHEIQRERLICIALDLFVEKGYENVTVMDIMLAAELSKGGMYHYFSSKEDILDAVVKYGLQQEQKRIEAQLKALPVEDRLPYFAISDEIGEFAQRLLGFSRDNRNSIVGYRMREQNVYFCIEILRGIFDDGISAGLFHTRYPQEMAEFCALMVRAMVDTNFLPETGPDGAGRRVQVFMHLMDKGMEIEADYANRLSHLFDNEVKEYGHDEKA